MQLGKHEGQGITLSKDIYGSGSSDVKDRYECENLYSSIWVKTGNMSLVSSGGGKLAINEFKSWMTSTNEILLSQSKLLCAEDEKILKINEGLFFRSEWLSVCESGEIVDAFENWRGNGKE